MKKLFTLILFCASYVLMAQTGTTIEDSIFSGGIFRKYTLYVPSSYNPADSVPLVFNIHGGSGDGNQQMAFGDFRPVADTANFIVVHPTAKMGNSAYGGVAPVWNTETCFEEDYDRIFLFALLDTLKQHYNIDTTRIYSAGYSQGGSMSYNFACYNNMNFAAIAPVATGMSYMLYSLCSPIRPTPVLIIKGTDDNYDGKGRAPYRTGTDSAVTYWIKFNNCDTLSVQQTNLPDINNTDNSTVEHFIWTGGDQGATVEFYKVHGGGHAWPAIVNTGGTTSPATGGPMILGERNMDFNAAREVWRFFRQHTLASATSASITPTPCPVAAPKPTGISFEKADVSDVSVYPNPTEGVFTLKNANYKDTKILLLNLVGELIFEEYLTNEFTQINVKNLPAGIYFYKVYNMNGNLKTAGKLVIQ